MINTRLIYISIIISLMISMLLYFYPSFDVRFSSFFYDEQIGFIYKNNIFVQFLFLSVPICTKLFIAACSCYLIYCITNHCTNSKYIILYLVFTCAIGPGLIVNHLFKENIGRARPSQISQFKGSKEFVPAFTRSNQCNHNCSFSSGHAAMAYYFTALGYAFALYQSARNSRDFTKIYLIALSFGSMVGFSRILMGGHFLSDVAVSCFIVLMINHLLYLCFRKLNIK